MNESKREREREEGWLRNRSGRVHRTGYNNQKDFRKWLRARADSRFTTYRIDNGPKGGLKGHLLKNAGFTSKCSLKKWGNNGQSYSAQSSPYRDQIPPRVSNNISHFRFTVAEPGKNCNHIIPHPRAVGYIYVGYIRAERGQIAKFRRFR